MVSWGPKYQHKYTPVFLYMCVFVYVCFRSRDRERKPYCLIISSELNRCVNRDSGAQSHQLDQTTKFKLSLSLSNTRTATCSHRQ